jgi:hypothetical protein
MKRLLCCLLLCSSIAIGQAPGIEQVQHARKAFIELDANDLSADAIHLALSTSRLGWTDDRGSADVILKFDRNVSDTKTTTEGTATNISVSWTYSLNVTLPDGTSVDHESASGNFVPRSDRTEEGWLKFLRTRPEYAITNEFLAKANFK